MANPLDWTAEKFEGTENPLGWAIGKSLRGINWASGGLLRGSGSLLRGAGRGVGSLRDRILDAQAKVVITADVGYRRGDEVDLGGITEQAVEGLDVVEHVVHLRR